MGQLRHSPDSMNVGLDRAVLEGFRTAHMEAGARANTAKHHLKGSILDNKGQ